MSPMETGVRRLDELLKGGLPNRTVTLVYGPPFLGKRLLGRMFLMEGMRNGMPGILVHTDSAAQEVRAQMAQLDDGYSDLEKKGLMYYVDTYSKSIGAAEPMQNVEYVDGLMNFNALSLSLNNVQRSIIKQHADHRLVFDSVSTLIAYTNAQAAFRYLQVLTGKARMAGATTVLLLEQGMHTESEVQTIKHLADGVVEMRREADKNLMTVEGVGLPMRVGPVEYQRSQANLSITGSFAAGRIR